MIEHDDELLELAEYFPNLLKSPCKKTSKKTKKYNCIAFAVGDLMQWWEDIQFGGYRPDGYYWPPGIPGSDTLVGWITVFELHGYTETNDRGLESEFEKIAIYVKSELPEHVARQKASGMWTSKMGKEIDIEHTLEALEGEDFGNVEKIMKRKCKDGKRVLENI